MHSISVINICTEKMLQIKNQRNDPSRGGTVFDFFPFFPGKCTPSFEIMEINFRFVYNVQNIEHHLRNFVEMNFGKKRFYNICGSDEARVEKSSHSKHGPIQTCVRDCERFIFLNCIG